MPAHVHAVLEAIRDLEQAAAEPDPEITAVQDTDRLGRDRNDRDTDDGLRWLADNGFITTLLHKEQGGPVSFRPRARAAGL
jgi:hypothetical protein